MNTQTAGDTFSPLDMLKERLSGGLAVAMQSAGASIRRMPAQRSAKNYIDRDSLASTAADLGFDVEPYRAPAFQASQLADSARSGYRAQADRLQEVLASRAGFRQNKASEPAATPASAMPGKAAVSALMSKGLEAMRKLTPESSASLEEGEPSRIYDLLKKMGVLSRMDSKNGSVRAAVNAIQQQLRDRLEGASRPIQEVVSNIEARIAPSPAHPRQESAAQLQAREDQNKTMRRRP